MKPTDKWPLKTLVEVDWIDSCVRGRWDSQENYATESGARCRTAGYLLKKTPKVVIIMQSQGLGGSVADSMTIPMSCVTKIRRLK